MFKIFPFDSEIFKLDFELTKSVFFFPLEEIKRAKWKSVFQEESFFSYYL